MDGNTPTLGGFCRLIGVHAPRPPVYRFIVAAHLCCRLPFHSNLFFTLKWLGGQLAQTTETAPKIVVLRTVFLCPLLSQVSEGFQELSRF